MQRVPLISKDLFSCLKSFRCEGIFRIFENMHKTSEECSQRGELPKRGKLSGTSQYFLYAGVHCCMNKLMHTNVCEDCAMFNVQVVCSFESCDWQRGCSPSKTDPCMIVTYDPLHILFHFTILLCFYRGVCVYWGKCCM